MDRLTDLELLRQYAAEGSEEAFRLVVQRHFGLVRGVALRQMGSDHLADEVSHAVFLALAQKAGALPDGTVVAGWLFRATRFAAAKLARDEERRSRREKEAAMIQIDSISDADDSGQIWEKITPHLNDALESLALKDRHAVLLRFFEQRSFAEVGKNLGASEDAAKMRVGRAVEKLRQFFRKRGFILGAGALASALSANACPTVPAANADQIASSVLQGGGASGPAATLADLILWRLWLVRIRAWLVVGVMVFLTGLIIGTVGYRAGWFGNRRVAPTWRPQQLPAQRWPRP